MAGRRNNSPARSNRHLVLLYNREGPRVGSYATHETLKSVLDELVSELVEQKKLAESGRAEASAFAIEYLLDNPDFDLDETHRGKFPAREAIIDAIYVWGVLSGVTPIRAHQEGYFEQGHWRRSQVSQIKIQGPDELNILETIGAEARDIDPNPMIKSLDKHLTRVKKRIEARSRRKDLEGKGYPTFEQLIDEAGFSDAVEANMGRQIDNFDIHTFCRWAIPDQDLLEAVVDANQHRVGRISEDFLPIDKSAYRNIAALESALYGIVDTSENLMDRPYDGRYEVVNFLARLLLRYPKLDLDHKGPSLKQPHPCRHFMGDVAFMWSVMVGMNKVSTGVKSYTSGGITVPRSISNRYVRVKSDLHVLRRAAHGVSGRNYNDRKNYVIDPPMTKLIGRAANRFHHPVYPDLLGFCNYGGMVEMAGSDEVVVQKFGEPIDNTAIKLVENDLHALTGQTYASINRLEQPVLVVVG